MQTIPELPDRQDHGSCDDGVQSTACLIYLNHISGGGGTSENLQRTTALVDTGVPPDDVSFIAFGADPNERNTVPLYLAIMLFLAKTKRADTNVKSFIVDRQRLCGSTFAQTTYKYGVIYYNIMRHVRTMRVHLRHKCVRTILYTVLVANRNFRLWNV